MRRTIQLCATTATPVHWLKDQSSLRAYLAQRDHCLQLYNRARSQGFSGQVVGLQRSTASRGRGVSPAWTTHCEEPGPPCRGTP